MIFYNWLDKKMQSAQFCFGRLHKNKITDSTKAIEFKKTLWKMELNFQGGNDMTEINNVKFFTLSLKYTRAIIVRDGSNRELITYTRGH